MIRVKATTYQMKPNYTNRYNESDDDRINLDQYSVNDQDSIQELEK